MSLGNCKRLDIKFKNGNLIEYTCGKNTRINVRINVDNGLISVCEYNGPERKVLMFDLHDVEAVQLE